MDRLLAKDLSVIGYRHIPHMIEACLHLQGRANEANLIITRSLLKNYFPSEALSSVID
jgi:hypothetical protein